MSCKSIPILLLAIFLIGCITSSYDKSDLIIDESYMPAIEKYILENPHYNTFLIKESDTIVFSKKKYPAGILIGPGYCDLVESKGYCFFDKGGSRVYIYSDTIVTMKSQSNLNVSNKRQWINKNPKDSVKLVNTDIRLYNSWENFIYRAAFIYEENHNIYINRSPDTIFVPKFVESPIKFEKLGDPE